MPWRARSTRDFRAWPVVLALLAAPLAFAQAKDPLLVPIPEPAEKIASFEDALKLLRAHNSDLQIQVARVHQAEGDSRVALARILPSLTGTALAQQNVLHPGQNFVVGVGANSVGATVDADTPQPTHVLGLGTLSATLPLIDLGGWKGWGAARASERAAELTLADLHRTLIRDLAQRLITAVATERLAELERVALRNASERLEIAERSFRLGASNRLDVVRLEQDFQVTRGQVLTANEVLRKARENLGLLLGRPIAVGLEPGFNLAGMAEHARSVCTPLTHLSARADMLAQQELIEAAGQRVGEATAAYLPTLAIQSEVFAFTVDPGPVQVPAWNIAAVLQFTFWDGGARGGNRTRAEAQQREAEERAVAAQRAAQLEVVQARRAIEVARDRMREAGRARDLAIEGDRLTRRSFELGRGSSVDLVQSASTLRQAELNLALREFDLASAVAEAFVSISSCRL